MNACGELFIQTKKVCIHEITPSLTAHNHSNMTIIYHQQNYIAW